MNVLQLDHIHICWIWRGHTYTIHRKYVNSLFLSGWHCWAGGEWCDSRGPYRVSLHCFITFFCPDRIWTLTHHCAFRSSWECIASYGLRLWLQVTEKSIRGSSMYVWKCKRHAATWLSIQCRPYYWCLSLGNAQKLEPHPGNNFLISRFKENKTSLWKTGFSLAKNNDWKIIRLSTHTLLYQVYFEKSVPAPSYWHTLAVAHNEVIFN